MGLDRSIPISSVQLTSTLLPVGWRYAMLGGSAWLPSVLSNGTTVLTCSGSYTAIASILQGGLLFETPEEYVGIPNKNTPIVDVVFAGSFAGIFKVLQVIDDNTLLVSDPQGLFVAGTTLLYGLCSRFNPPTSIDLDAAGAFDAKFLDGTGYQFCPTPVTYKGTPLEPFLLSSSDTIIATITR